MSAASARTSILPITSHQSFSIFQRLGRGRADLRGRLTMKEQRRAFKLRYAPIDQLSSTVTKRRPRKRRPRNGRIGFT
jgi:hypothetical protein